MTPKGDLMIQTLAMPGDTNPNGDIFGGWIVSQMDLVITSCTSIAHIAASQGKQVCVFVPIMEYYVWTSSTGKSWWYGDNVHLFKQKKPRNWDEPLKQLEVFLNDRGI